MAIDNGKPDTNGNAAAAAAETEAPAIATIKKAAVAPPAPVTVTATCTVLPAAKPADAPAATPLATFDLPYITFYYNQKLLLYRLAGDGEGGAEFASAVGKMKAALATALGWFYPLAGRIKQDEEGVLFVEGDDGVEAVEAAAEGVAVAELAEGDGDDKLMQLLVPYTGVMNLEGLSSPLLAVQFTKLKDGLAVGCAFNHAILDGNSTWHFMSSWSELCRAAASDNAAAVPSTLPLHDRLSARSVRVPLTLPASPAAHEALDPNGPPKPLVARVFSFPAALISHLKAAANSAAGEAAPAKPLSTFQCLGAHLWRCVTRARAVPGDAITVFAVFADCRPRVAPPQPARYFGNVIQAIFTGMPAGMLLAVPPSAAAGLLQKTIDAHDDAAIVKRLEEYEAAPKLFYYSDAGTNCVAVGSSPRFQVYGIDFGFGAPARVRSGANNKFDGMVYLYPGRDGGGAIDVELTLQPEAMEMLEKDPEFLPEVAASVE